MKVFRFYPPYDTSIYINKEYHEKTLYTYWQLRIDLDDFEIYNLYRLQPVYHIADNGMSNRFRPSALYKRIKIKDIFNLITDEFIMYSSNLELLINTGRLGGAAAMQHYLVELGFSKMNYEIL